MNDDEVTQRIIGAAIEVHRTLGPGLLESVYEECLEHEFRLRKLSFDRQRRVPVVYKSHPVGADLRMDFLVEDRVVVELKAIEKLLPIHGAQLLTYLRLTDKPLGLLINFNVSLLREGIRRVIHSSAQLCASAPLR
jgi:GxxExxY protein